ncbi:MAG: hypothetical protein OXH66_10095 [Gemmatimonadetes bacterium]|nr:hypothetical protein [Gemmatimonadota bacterium]
MSSGQFIKYQTTNISAKRSASQIQALCKQYGARKIEARYVDNEIESIRFILDTKRGPIPILVRAPTEPVYQVFRKNRPAGNRKGQRAQAHRVAWRHMRDLTEQRLLAAKINVEDPAEAFMAHIEQEPGVTTGQLMLEQVEARGGFENVLQLPLGA